MARNVELKIIDKRIGTEFPKPARSTAGSAGYDLRAMVKEDTVIHPGERIAQLVFLPVIQAGFTEVDEFDKSERGEGGFGSTGV